MRVPPDDPLVAITPVVDAFERLGVRYHIDVFVPEMLPFDQQEQNRAQLRTLDDDANARKFFVKSPEDLVLRKLSWYRAGGESSPQQWSDVIGVLRLQAGRLDRTYLTHWAAELSVGDLLERAFTEARHT